MIAWRKTGWVFAPRWELSSYLPHFSFLRFAQYAFMRFDCAFRAAAPIPLCRFFAGAGAGVMAAINGFLGGRPRRFTGPCSASMARLSRSRSAMSKASIWSVGISHGSYHKILRTR